MKISEVCYNRGMEQFDEFCRLLLKYNRVHRISGVKNETDIRSYIEDALYPIPYAGEFATCLDIGTGAGFPGMVLAIAYPEVAFTLAEPIAKRTAFLHLVKAAYGLKNVDIQTRRVEEISPFGADLITSRAVTKTDLLMKLAADFITPKTKMLLYKGSSVLEELDETMAYEIIKRENRNYLILKGMK